MTHPRSHLDRRGLLCVAAPTEARAVIGAVGGAVGEAAANLPPEWVLHPLHPAFDLVISGVGKSNAAGATARTFDTNLHAWILNVGICGALPHPGRAHPLNVGAAMAATASVFADEGILADSGFSDLSRHGFPSAPDLHSAIPVDPLLLLALAPLVDTKGPIATVSTCSGTDAYAREVALRTGGLAEAMEGAAVGLVAHRLGVPFGELRVVSNTTGSRTQQHWDLPGALARLSDLIARLPAALAVRAGAAGEP